MFHRLYNVVHLEILKKNMLYSYLEVAIENLHTS